jgi:hypothetical protein
LSKVISVVAQDFSVSSGAEVSNPTSNTSPFRLVMIRTKHFLSSFLTVEITKTQFALGGKIECKTAPQPTKQMFTVGF